MARDFINSVKYFIETSTKNMRHNKSIFYYGSFFFILIMYFIFFNANSILADNSPIMNTNLGAEVDVGSTKLYVTKCEYDRDKNFMEVELNYSDSSDNIQSQLKFSAIAKVNTNKKLNVKTMITTDDTYIIHIENVPENYEAIALKVSQNSNDNISPVSLSDFTNSTNTENGDNGFPNDTAKIYFDNRKVNINNNIKVETQKNYIVDITRTQISNIENNIKTINTNIKYNNNLVDIANSNINNLNNQYQYEIQQVQNETTLKINNYNSKINEIKKHNNDLKNTALSLQQEINELDKKINDITKKPDLKNKVITKKLIKK